MTEEEKMLDGQLYNPTDSVLAEKRARVRFLQEEYNFSRSSEGEKREYLINQIFKKVGKNCYLEPTIKFDYGCNTEIGDNFFANYNSIFLDVAEIKIGDNVMFGPNVTIATPMHPLVAEERIIREDENGVPYDLEYAKPITIKDNVWLASNVLVCGGVTIGKGTVVGAGSVVTKSLPDGVLAYGNPCKVIRPITDADLIINKK